MIADHLFGIYQIREQNRKFELFDLCQYSLNLLKMQEEINNMDEATRKQILESLKNPDTPRIVFPNQDLWEKIFNKIFEGIDLDKP